MNGNLHITFYLNEPNYWELVKSEIVLASDWLVSNKINPNWNIKP